MKKFAFGAALAMMVTPALAADPGFYLQDPVVEQPSQVSGHAEGYLGGLRLTGDFYNGSAWMFGGDARVNVAVDRRWNIQGDLYGEGIRFNDVGFNLDRFGAAAHAYWRDPDSFAIGAFGKFGTYPLLFGSNGTEYLLGPEAQAYFGNVTVYGQAYWGQINGPGFPIGNQWGARGVVRYFLHDNFRLDGELAYNFASFPGDSIRTFTALAQANYRFDDTPFTILGRYQFDTRSDTFFGERHNTHRLVVGLRVSVGADTLKAEDRYGATMDLPRHVRWLE